MVLDMSTPSPWLARDEIPAATAGAVTADRVVGGLVEGDADRVAQSDAAVERRADEVPLDPVFGARVAGNVNAVLYVAGDQIAHEGRGAAGQAAHARRNHRRCSLRQSPDDVVIVPCSTATPSALLASANVPSMFVVGGAFHAPYTGTRPCSASSEAAGFRVRSDMRGLPG